ncbi:MAG: TatD family hydrolase [Treponema sp.]|nr:TatD family hydrolase [Treponema sp.]
MFSDTHFHFRLLSEGDYGLNGTEILEKMAERDCAFGLDIGTRADDLQVRQASVESAICGIKDSVLAEKARNFMYFSAGIWPDVGAIHSREQSMKTLEECILKAQNDEHQDILHRKIIAVGECGIDHHWNPGGVDGRKEDDFDEKTYKGERELFEAQLALAKKMKLPIIVHSRDGFEDTLDCIKNSGYDKGIIHCYSYGLQEAKAFLDRGWYISFSGSVTYTKKSKLEEMNALLNYVPEDRLLCETDAPYLAPVPMRGNPNCPVYVEHTYEYIAKARSIELQALCNLVDKNIQELFFSKS